MTTVRRENGLEGSTFGVYRFPLSVQRFTAFDEVKRRTVNAEQETLHVGPLSPFPVVFVSPVASLV